jgi:hydrogenase-1 operon protein HyaE
VQRLIDAEVATPIRLETVDAWLERGGLQVLFFSGDPVRFPEGADVAVVLPELRAAFGGRFEIGVVERTGEDAIARRFASMHWPALVVLRDGRWVARIDGMKDWDDYLREVGAALDKPASPPPIAIAVVAAGSGCH